MGVYGITPDATTTSKGKIILAGDLGGTADAPTVVGVTGVAWTSFTPTWTNLTVGNGTNAGYYKISNKTFRCRVQFIFGTTSSISGAVQISSLPFTMNSNAYSATERSSLGTGNALDSGTNIFKIEPLWNTSTSVLLRTVGVSGSFTNFVDLSSTSPMTWTTSDRIFVQFFGEIA